VRAVLLLAVAGIAAVSACGTSAATKPKSIHFGLAGGNIAGYTAAIRADGRVTVTVTGLDGFRRGKITVKRVRKLGREISRAHLASRRCARSNPDFASRFIRLGGRTVSVRGSCEQRFDQVWDDLAQVVAHLHK
jgi:hypothetical protein